MPCFTLIETLRHPFLWPIRDEEHTKGLFDSNPDQFSDLKQQQSNERQQQSLANFPAFNRAWTTLTKVGPTSQFSSYKCR